MKIRKKLTSKSGMAQYVQFLIVLVMLMTAIATGLEIAGVIVIKKGIDDMAAETARYVELRGALNSAVYAEFDRLKGVTGVPGTLSVDGDFSSGGRLQLEAPFTVTVAATGHLFHLEIPLVARATGRSEVYHK